jgi:enoyl-CoA hydratase/carnithine racemase
VPKVFIAVINGHAMGGGLEIALACDLRFAGDGEFRMGLPEVTLGLLPGNGGTQRLPRLIGTAKALSMMITGETIGPQEALALGIVDKVFPMGSLWEDSLAYAQQLAGGPTVAIGYIKRTVHEGIAMSLEDGLALERDLMRKLYETEDSKEGISAFAEKRKAEFKGR